MAKDTFGGMDPEEFRTIGKEVVDWIADYLKKPENYPVFPNIQPGDIKEQLPTVPPSSSEKMDVILQDFNKIIIPGITHWNHPGFHAYFSVTGSAPGILGEMLSAALNINGMLWRTSPSATELEEVTLDWLRQMLGLPAEFRGVITDCGSASNLIAIAAARESIHKRIREEGLAGRRDLPKLRLYCSDQTHSSVEKAAIVLGIGQEGVRKIPSDAEFKLNVKALAASIEEDRNNGWFPFAVVATVGTTSSTSIDPVPAIADICQKEKLWLHIDAAYGGMAGVIPEMRYLLDGCDRADSFVTNPHKWLFTPIDCSALYTRHVATLKQAFSLIPEYLTTSDDSVNNYMDWGVQLGRRFRALKLWFVIRSFGVNGIVGQLRKPCNLALEFASWIKADKDFELLAPVPLGVVCFRYHPHRISDETKLEHMNKKIIDQINSTGEAFLSHTKLHGKYTIRLAIGNPATTEQHLKRVWELIKAETDKF
ncbi:MAG: pyridoxal-dependent decarboxylase [Ignavibacteriales bacterium]|nr:pyridoxal-dependent decarboxylase [Ignavibacteriales bacterium]